MRLLKKPLRSILAPPYRYLPWLLFAYLFFDVAIHPEAAFWTHKLADPDDYMRLNQVINWLTGQGWYDLSQPRLSPGAHTIVHWARLVDLPLAAVILPLAPFYGMMKAALIASFIVPPLLFILLIILIPRLSRPLLGKKRANLALPFLLFAPIIIFNFSPGRVDHHGYQILIAGYGLYGLLVALLCRNGWPAAALSAVAFSCGLWIGTEILPILILTAFAFSVFGPLRGGNAFRNMAVFGAALFGSSLLLLPIALPVTEWGSRAISWFSSAFVIFSSLTGLAFLASWGIFRHQSRPALRIIGTLFLATVAAGLFFVAVPEARQGPFADYDQFNATTALDNIHEAMPLYKSLVILPHNSLSYWAVAGSFFQELLPPFIAFLVCLYAATRGSQRKRMLWSIMTVFVGTTTLLTFFYQMRMTWFLNLYRLVPLAYLFIEIIRGFEGQWSTVRKVAVGLLLLLILGPASLLVLSSLFSHILDPEAGVNPNTCRLNALENYLDQTDGLGQTSKTILAPFDDGPELLFRTPHKLIGANFNVPGNRDVYDFFNSREDPPAQDILRRWAVDLVITCRVFPAFYAGRAHPEFGRNAFLSTGSDGKLHITSSLSKPSLIERLAAGRPPSWLKPVEIEGNSDYLVYQVKP